MHGPWSPWLYADQECRKAASSAATSARNIGCSSIAGEYRLAGTSRPSASAMARTWCGPRRSRSRCSPRRGRGPPGEVGHLEPGAREGLELDRETRSPSVGRSDSNAGAAASSGRAPAGPRPRSRPPPGSAPAAAASSPGRGSSSARRLGARGGQDPARLDVVVAVVGLVRLRRRERDHGRQAELLAHLQADQRLAEVVVGLGDDEVDALLDRPAELLGVLRPHGRPVAGSAGS